MFFHWWRFFALVGSAIRRGAVARDTHRLAGDAPAPFLPYLPLSDFCYRRTEEVRDAALRATRCTSGPARVSSFAACDRRACDRRSTRGPRAQVAAAARAVPDGDAVDVVIDGLGLRAQPPPTRVRVGLISRRWKRFLLNERELGYALLDAGYDVRLLALEDMTLYEQVAALRATTVLVGVHGSGLNNALYLRPGAAVLQIVPFGLRYRGDFEGIATRNGVSYGELVLEDRRRSVFHWEFLDPERLVAGRAAVLDAGSPPGGREVYAFWVNQDVVVPRAAFLGAVRGAAASPLNRRLLAG